MEQNRPTIHRILLSTSSRFTGEYVSPDIEMRHAWPDFFGHNRQPEAGMQASPYSRNYFVLSIEIEDPPVLDGRPNPIPNYRYYGERFCAVLSILYGKRFDSHGFLVSHGFFSVPDLSDRRPTMYYTAGPNSHIPRKDLEIPLKLDEVRRITPLFIDEAISKHFLDILFAAGRFYVRSLQIFDFEPEFAYLDLVTCGEVLANYYKFPTEELYDEDTRVIFNRIRTEMDKGDEIIKRFTSSMRQIKRAYTFTLTRLLTDYFFANAETTEEYGRLCKDDIETRIKAAYDLRSLYVHTGIDFGRWTHPHGGILNEIQLGRPVISNNNRFEKAAALAPTYFGLERIMRYCLLRFIHLHGVPIDDRLDGPPPSATAAHAVKED